MLNHSEIAIQSTKLRMNRRSARSRAGALVLIICLLIMLFPLHPVKPAYGQTLLVPSEYETIQEAVDYATAGAVVQVTAGIYYEHVSVNKSLALIGEDPQTTVVDGTSNGAVFDLDEASNVYITGFTIRNAGNTHNAITSSKAIATNDYHEIVNNIITTSQHGVFLSYSRSNTIFNNTFVNNVFSGIYLNRADDTNISANVIVDSAYGVQSTSTANADIIGNTISQTSYAIHLTSSSTGATVRDNLISGKTVGVYSTSDDTTVDHNTIEEGAYGVYFYNCHDGSVYYNTFRNNSYGIRLYMSPSSTSSHTISNNKILYTDWALELVNAHGNMFTGNWLQQNTYGIYMASSSSNTVYRNNFVNNNMQTYSGTGTGNAWDRNISGKRQGNYWSDYTGVDEDPRDGIGDTPYRIIPVGYDNYPLMTTWSEHDIAIQNVTISTHETHPGPMVNITVTVENNANISVSETFTVTTNYGLNIIETEAVVDLAPGEGTTLVFNWNTTDVVPGNYTISAEASVVSDELNTDNNNFIDGSIYVIIPGDVNIDGTINNDDLTLLIAAYGSTPTSPHWNSDADLNKDNVIDALDLSTLCENYGKTA
jgi:parallel beta-helix repeat (two copies)